MYEILSLESFYSWSLYYMVPISHNYFPEELASQVSPSKPLSVFTELQLNWAILTYEGERLTFQQQKAGGQRGSICRTLPRLC